MAAYPSYYAAYCQDRSIRWRGVKVTGLFYLYLHVIQNTGSKYLNH